MLVSPDVSEIHQTPWERVRRELWEHPKIKALNLNNPDHVQSMHSLNPGKVNAEVVMLYGGEVKSVPLETAKVIIEKAQECRDHGIGMCFLSANELLRQNLQRQGVFRQFTFFDELAQIINLFPEWIRETIPEEPEQNYQLPF